MQGESQGQGQYPEVIHFVLCLKYVHALQMKKSVLLFITLYTCILYFLTVLVSVLALCGNKTVAQCQRLLHVHVGSPPKLFLTSYLFTLGLLVCHISVGLSLLRCVFLCLSVCTLYLACVYLMCNCPPCPLSPLSPVLAELQQADLITRKECKGLCQPTDLVGVQRGKSPQVQAKTADALRRHGFEEESNLLAGKQTLPLIYVPVVYWRK